MSFGRLPYDFPLVDRVPAASAADREQLERAGRPVVITGAMND